MRFSAWRLQPVPKPQTSSRLLKISTIILYHQPCRQHYPARLYHEPSSAAADTGQLIWGHSHH